MSGIDLAGLESLVTAAQFAAVVKIVRNLEHLKDELTGLGCEINIEISVVLKESERDPDRDFRVDPGRKVKGAK